MPNNSSLEYWKKRYEEEMERAMHQADGPKKDLRKYADTVIRRLEKDINDWYQRYANENGMSLADAKKQLDARELKAFNMDLEEYRAIAERDELSEEHKKMLKKASARQQLDRVQELYINTVQELESWAKYQDSTISDLLSNVYESSNYRTAWMTQSMKGQYDMYAQVDHRTIQRIIDSPWTPDGKNFSARIWDNRKQLATSLQNDFIQALIAGDGTATMSEAIAKRMNTSYNNANRLVETELARVHSQAFMDCMNELDVDAVEILATLDNKTSPICRRMDGKYVQCKDAKPGITIPPFHCHCRSTTVPYIPAVYGTERAARDPKTGKTVFVDGELKYEDWKREYVGEFGGEVEKQPKKAQPVQTEQKARKEKKKAKKDVLNIDIDTASVEDIINAGKAISEKHGIAKLVEKPEELKKVFSQYRRMGAEMPDSDFYKNSDKKNKADIKNVFTHYPEDWYNSFKQSGRTLITRHRDRGFFAPYACDARGNVNQKVPGSWRNDYYTICMDGLTSTTPYHEVGHMIEALRPNVKRLAGEFINRRTANDKEVRLKDLFPGAGYTAREVVKPDNFISPYIGKIYKWGDTEAISMGLQTLFVDEGTVKRYDTEKRKYIQAKLTDDLEFMHFIVGIVAFA